MMNANSAWQGDERRRSQRLALTIPVRVSYFAKDPGRLVSEAHTIMVSAHGALLRLPWGAPVGQVMLVQQVSSQETKGVIVASVAYAGDGNYEIGVEFETPNPTFWGVTFPPEDWSADHADAKPCLVNSY